MIDPKQEWFTLADLVAAQLPDLPRADKALDNKLRQLRLANPSLARQVPAATKPVWQYHVNILPKSARAKLAYVATTMSEAEEQAESRRKLLWARFEGLSKEHKVVCEQRFAILVEIDDMVMAGMSNLAAIRKAAKEHRQGVRTLYTWQEMVQGHARQDWLAALTPSFSKATDGVVAEFAECHPSALDYLKADYLRLEKPAFAACYRRMVELATEKGWSPIPSERSLRRRIEAEVPQAALIMAREGRKSAAKLYPAMKRSTAHLHAMQIVNTDGHKIDLFVTVPWSKKPVRLLLLGIQDIFSRKILSWRLAEAETWDVVRACIGDMVEQFGIPEKIYMDNGRAFASKKISGGALKRNRFKVTKDEFDGLLKTLGIEPHFVKPYSGQSKPIERAWRDLAEHIAKHPAVAGAYTGNTPENKPENYGTRAIPLAELQVHVAACIAEHNARAGRKAENCKGRSFDETFAASMAAPGTIVRLATEAQRSLWLLAAETVTARKPDGAIHLAGNRYWSGELNQWIGKKVQIRFDPTDLHRAVKVYDPAGRLICDAPVVDTSGFDTSAAAALHEKAKRRHDKATKEKLASELALTPMQLGEIAARGRKALKTERPEPIRPTITRLATGNLAPAPQVEEMSDDEAATAFSRAMSRLSGDSAIIPFPMGNTAPAMKAGHKSRTDK
ncbi:MAG: transposase [Shinella sp.]|nr:MAG: transposase [Shinella sp.]